MSGRMNEQHNDELSVSANVSLTTPDSWSAWAKKNWVTLVVVALVIAGLIYWFKFRKTDGSGSTISISSPSTSPSGPKVEVSRVRGLH